MYSIRGMENIMCFSSAPPPPPPPKKKKKKKKTVNNMSALASCVMKVLKKCRMPHNCPASLDNSSAQSF